MPLLKTNGVPASDLPNCESWANGALRFNRVRFDASFFAPLTQAHRRYIVLGSAMVASRATVACAALLAAAVPALAHHALAAKYNTAQPITVTGTVKKIAWMNPHAHLYIDTQDGKSVVMNWDLEMASPNMLFLNGWKIDSFRTGDRVSVEIYPARDGSDRGFATKVKLTSP